MLVFDSATLVNRQKRAGDAFDAVTEPGDVIVVSSGRPVTKPGGHDQTYPFLPHPEYLWLSGSRRSHGVMVYRHKKGWTHFVRKVDFLERLWEGDPSIPEGEDVLGFSKWFSSLQKTGEAKRVALLGGNETFEGLSLVRDDAFVGKVQQAVDQTRRKKDAAEVELIRKAAKAAAEGFRKAREVIRPGVTERQIQIELEAEMRRHGAHKTPYDTIVGAGTNAAILHFEPSDRVVGENDLILIDAGADIHDYCTDITRVFPATNRFTQDQQAIYDIVLRAQRVGIEMCRPGVEWHDVQRAAARVIGEGLRDLKILRGEIDSLLESGAVSIFFPHGVGHMVGLRVRDVGGAAPGRKGRQVYGVNVRVDLPLEEGFLMTVEPGLYFVAARIDDAETRAKYADSVDWSLVDRYRSVGGVRIEDDVLVASKGPDVLTAQIPK